MSINFNFLQSLPLIHSIPHTNKIESIDTAFFLKHL